jgi:DNA polymerase-3 subunit beta
MIAMLDRTTDTITAAEIILTAGDLHDALRRVRHAICKEETRYYLNGVYLHHVMRDGVLRFVATDGHRIATADIRAAEGAHNIPPMILSRSFVTEAIKATNKTRDAFKHLHLAIGATRVTLTDWNGNAIDGELVDGTFPNYEGVIPRGEPQHGTATLAREPFMQAVAAATAFAKASGAKWSVSPILRFAFTTDKLTVSAALEGNSSACRGSASVAFDVGASTMTEARDIGFYGPQVLDILGSLQGQHVRFDFFDVGGPNNFAGDCADGSALHVIMPVGV